jgi:hypothetical protein
MDMFTQLEGEKMQMEAQIQSLLKYDSEALLIYASGLDLPDNIIKTIYPQYLELKRQIEGMKASGLGDRHPTVVSNKRILDQMKGQLDEGVINLRTRLQGQLDMVVERLAKVEIRKKETKKDALERSIDTTDYVDAKRDSLMALYPEYESFDKGFQVDGKFFDGFLEYSDKEGVQLDEEGMAISGKIIRLRLRALTARGLWGTEEFFRVFNDEDTAVKAALESIQDKTFKKLKLAYN